MEDYINIPTGSCERTGCDINLLNVRLLRFSSLLLLLHATNLCFVDSYTSDVKSCFDCKTLVWHTHTHASTNTCGQVWHAWQNIFWGVACERNNWHAKDVSLVVWYNYYFILRDMYNSSNFFKDNQENKLEEINFQSYTIKYKTYRTWYPTYLLAIFLASTNARPPHSLYDGTLARLGGRAIPSKSDD